MDKKYLEKDECAVSPVIGVILMVAVTVTLASIVGSAAFGMGSNINKMNLVVVSAEQMNLTTIEFTFMGGPDASTVRYLNATIDGAPADPPADYEPDVGSGWVAGSESFHTSGGFTGKNHVVVAATFNDGSAQVVLDTYV
ncbi:MAG: type IV pilin [Methanosarcinales archaeon]|jgi:flagellin-like protein|nr:type IV pilin [Methanosarcinales archaeon]